MWVLASVALLILAAGLWLLSSADRQSDSERRVERAAGGAMTSAAESHNDQPVAQAPLDPITAPLYRALRGAGFVPTANRIRMGLALAVLASVCLLLIGELRGLILVVALWLFGWLMITTMQRRQRQKINQQLPTFLGYVMRSLTAGNSLEEALYAAALESTDPIRSVFLRVSGRLRMGADIEPTLEAVAADYQLRALHILAMSAKLNRRYGGSMRRIIATLVDTIRQQEAAASELKALTGETRFSAYVVAAIPIAISLFFYLQNPAYYATMLESSGGRTAIWLSLALEGAGLLIIWRMMAGLREPDQ